MEVAVCGIDEEWLGDLVVAGAVTDRGVTPPFELYQPPEAGFEPQPQLFERTLPLATGFPDATFSKQ